MIKANRRIKNIALSAMFLAIGLLLPLLTGQVPQIGRMLLPMHIPVLLCGLICGWQYGGTVGFTLPFLRNVLFGMPPMPGAISMAFELAIYGIVIGILYSHSRRKCIFSLYRSMLVAMLAGRIVWGLAQTALLGIVGKGFTWQMFMAGAFFDAIPGILLQLTLIPAIMVVLNRAGLVRFSPKESQHRAGV